ncbi:hypothetical protein BKP45_14960 [Anaerobacillus alkalidiazotrophicus]|uniref:histidine kinase n=1 Tax=Anaerobacillus alkalidiazotrophicus TaxID=472963 RepID=A0A1S2M260_9BACI|nr:sensor histidine kinase [Anaerobacillus alkalidiazotrophicus]OIJ18829.1 hypothetical protein BKP45_14960 [Anaerobacillus alkalidiazotrophicus]
MFKDMLVQIVIVLVPILLYYSMFRPNGYQLGRVQKKLVIGILMSVSVIICMLFPAVVGNETIMDLRSIPWLIAYYYGGPFVGLVVTAVLIIARFLISMTIGAYITLFIYSFCSVILIIFCKESKIIKTKKSNVVFMATLSAVLMVVCNYIYIFDLSLNGQIVLFFLFFVITNIVSVISVVSLIEALEERNLLYQQIHLKEKQYLVGQLAASIAHEIRNPMTVIRGFMQLMGQASDIPKSYQKYNKLMISELDRAEAIIHEYLSLAKEEVGKIRAINVKKELLQVKDTLHSYALLKSVNISFHCATENISMYGDQNKFKQVFLNIIKNAIEATEKKGNVTIYLKSTDSDVIVEVHDTGKGMSETQLSNLGMPFYSSKEKGTGLGLMVSYKIIEGMRGRIEVKSSEGVGTSFKVVFPRVGDL